MRKQIKKIKSLENLLLNHKPEFRNEMLKEKRRLLEYVKTECSSSSTFFLYFYESYLKEEIKNNNLYM